MRSHYDIALICDIKLLLCDYIILMGWAEDSLIKKKLVHVAYYYYYCYYYYYYYYY